MSCPHSRNRVTKETLDETVQRTSNRLAEGMCPNRCGALVRIAPHLAACGCCRIEWYSRRIPAIFPSGSLK